MGHLTNPISLRLGKKIWWKHQYNSLSKRVHENFFFFLQIFFDRFLSLFFGRKKRYEFQGTLYFGNRLIISQKIYLYIFLYDQKSEKHGSGFFARYSSKGFRPAVNLWTKRLKRFHRGCCRLMFLFDRKFWKVKELESKKRKALERKELKKRKVLEIPKMKKWDKSKRYYHSTSSGWSVGQKQKWKNKPKPKPKPKGKKMSFFQIRRHCAMILYFFHRIFPTKGIKFQRRFFKSSKFRFSFFKTFNFLRPFFYRLVLSNGFNLQFRKVLFSCLIWFSFKGSLYKTLEKYFRDRNQLELIFLCLRTIQRGNPLESLLITPKFLGEFITRKLDQRHKLRDVIHPVMKSIGKNKGIAGFKITCSGRFTRAERATYQWYKSGKISLNTVKLPILYDFTEKSLKFGMVSLKIWIQYREEVFKEYWNNFEQYVGIK